MATFRLFLLTDILLKIVVKKLRGKQRNKIDLERIDTNDLGLECRRCRALGTKRLSNGLLKMNAPEGAPCPLRAGGRIAGESDYVPRNTHFYSKTYTLPLNDMHVWNSNSLATSRACPLRS